MTTTASTKVIRSLYTIAGEIKKDWKANTKDGKIYFGAVPYLDAMQSLDGINDKYGYDSGKSIVSNFLANASTWRGDKAKEIKKELNAMLK